MNDHDHDPHVTERMDRAVGGLRAPDVLQGAMASGRRQRTRRRLAYGAGGIAAVTALALTLPAVAGDRQDPATTPVATDPTSATTASPAPEPGASEDNPCGEAATGWWSAPSEQVSADLATLLPAGTRVGRTDDDATGAWGGNLVTGGDEDFTSLTLLPPPGTPGGRLTLAELSEGGECFGGSNAPMQAVQPCDEISGVLDCEEIRAEDGELVGVVTEQVEQGTDATYVLAVVTGPEGGHVELYAASGTRSDRPDTVRDPADVPALSMEQAKQVVTDSGWTG